MHSVAPSTHPKQGTGLFFLALWLGLFGAALYALAGWPTLPEAYPSWTTIVVSVGSPAAGMGGLLDLARVVAWAVWGWTAFSIALRVVVDLADMASRGAAWVHSFRTVSDWLTLPPIRRVVDASLGGLILARVVSSQLGVAHAEPLPPAVVTVASTAAEAGAASQVSANGLDTPHVRYTVQPGDTLWSIAERFYGDGEQEARIFDANLGQVQADGRALNRHGLIMPGWELVVPDPTRSVETGAGEQWYIAQPGDTLSGIAAQLLGDARQADALFTANRGIAQTPDGRVLTNPDLIWPGLRVRLPSAPSRVDVPSPPAATATDAPGEPYAVPSVIAAAPAAGAAEPIDEPDADPPASVETEPPPVVQAPSEPAVALEPAPSTPLTSGAPGSAPALPVAAGAGAVALGGFAALALRRRRTRPLPLPRESDVVLTGGFAEVDASGEDVLAAPGEDGLTRLAARVLAHLGAEGPERPELVAAAHGRSGTTLTIQAPVALRARLPELARTLGALLGTRVDGAVTADHDLSLHVGAGLRIPLLPLMPEAADGAGRLPWLTPAGVLPTRQVLSLNWRALGNVLVASLPGQGAHDLLTGLLVSLSSRHSPDDLEVCLVGDTERVPPALDLLPQVRGPRIDPADTTALVIGFEALAAEVSARLQTGHPASARQLLVVVGELADLVPAQEQLDYLAAHGSAVGVQILAATMRPAAEVAPLATHLETRLVQRTPDEDTSLAWLGAPDAADLGGGGRYLLRIDGRRPIEACGFRIAPEALTATVTDLCARWPKPQAADNQAESASECASPSKRDQREARQSSSADAAAEAEGEAGALLGSPGELPLQAAVETPSAQAPEAAPSEAARPTETSEAVACARASTPLYVRCFGGLKVLAGDHEIWPAGGAGGPQKPWEVLAFLACQPNGVSSKDRLLSVLWPEADEGSSSGRLRTALWALRSTLSDRVPDLPKEVVRNERDGTCRLDCSVVSSDAQQFLTLAEAARGAQRPQAIQAYEQARALYRGDLLAEWPFAWLNERDDSALTPRERFREVYREITAALAELYAADNTPDAAVPLYKELLQFDPTDERLVRQLLVCYGRAGDRTGLVRTERALRQALNVDNTSPGDMPFEPEPATGALFRQLLTDVEQRRAPTPVAA